MAFRLERPVVLASVRVLLRGRQVVGRPEHRFELLRFRWFGK